MKIEIKIDIKTIDANCIDDKIILNLGKEVKLIFDKDDIPRIFEDINSVTKGNE